MNILVTGAAGFIGSHLVKRLLKDNVYDKVIGIDNIMNSYYTSEFKYHRLEEISKKSDIGHWIFYYGDITDDCLLKSIFYKYEPTVVVHLAAQSGVRDSINNPDNYIKTNLVGFYNVLELCKLCVVDHLVYASSSSVYGERSNTPFSIYSSTDKPISLYAATKKSNEILAYTYSKSCALYTTGLRFFTTYGPSGRPDMLFFKALEAFLNKQKLPLYNFGNNIRDFIYIDDVIEGIIRTLSRTVTSPDSAKVYNLGTGVTTSVADSIILLQNAITKAKLLPEDYNFEQYKKLVPREDADMSISCADTKDFDKDFNFIPQITLQEGLERFVNWYKEYKNL